MNAAEQAQMRRYDPLTFDMDGDGIDLISLENSNAFFDLDGDGMQEKVGWIGNDDAILAFDRNDNGKIDNIDELFGKQNNDGTIILGTEELATYDENNDGIIDEQDAIFKQLKLWHDQNENAQTEVGELKTLTEDNITSINIQEISEVNQVVEGNVILSTSTYQKTDGTEEMIANLDLAIDQTNSQYYEYNDKEGNKVNDYELNIETLFLPYSRGYGNLKSLHVAMSQDNNLLQQMKELHSLDYKNNGQINQRVENILYQWAGVLDVTGKRGLFDARKLNFLEELRGEAFLDSNNNSDIQAHQLALIESSWSKVFEFMKKRFLVQGLYSSIFSDASYSFEEDKIIFRGLSKEDLFKNIDNYYQKLSLDSNIDKLSFINHMSSIVKSVKSAYDLSDSEIDENIIILTGLNPKAVFVGNQNLYQSLNNNDLLIQSSLQEKNDIITSGQGRDYIATNQGNDVIKANENHDILIGGQGNDQLYGGSGNDTYIYNKGDGKDVISDISGRADIIKLGAGISKEDVYFQVAGNNLIIKFLNDEQNQITVKDHFNGNNNQIEKLKFSDDSEINLTNILESYHYGNENDNNISGNKKFTNIINGKGWK